MGSWHLSCPGIDFVFGTLLFPLAFTYTLGERSSSKNRPALELYSKMYLGGTPFTSMMQAICSASLSPGKMGMPVKSSQRMQPKDHMSISM